MDDFMMGTVLVNAVLFSVLLALWLTSLALRGLFHLMPATRVATTQRSARTPHFDAGRHHVGLHS
jgi:hypothetical protein